MAGIKLTIKFDPLLEKIQAANGDVAGAAVKAATESAKVVEAELKATAGAAGVPSSITSEIGTEVNVENAGNRATATVGWKMGGFNSSNPSAGYKAVFLNYGTARRSVRQDKMRLDLGGGFKTFSTNRGAITGRGFIAKAIEQAAPKVKKTQRAVLKETLKGLGG